jgi:hypothetical protein
MVSSCGIICPYFLEDVDECVLTVSAEQCEVILENFLSNELHRYDLHIGFQLDEVTAYTAQMSIEPVCHMWSQQLIADCGDIS